METGSYRVAIGIPQRRATDRLPTLPSNERFIGKKELRELVSISPQHIDRLEKRGDFPKRVRLGPGRVAWQLSKVHAWMADKIAASRPQ